MTSEVVVMNRQCVALASDSAATIEIDGRAKLFQADKLFMLSKRHPVGIMTYHNSSLLQVPWETIIKMYRAHLGDGEKLTLKDYTAHFLEYLASNDRLFPIEEQHREYQRMVDCFFFDLSTRIRNRVLDELLYTEDGTTVTQDQIAKTMILEELSRWDKMAASPTLVKGTGEKYASQHSGEINGMIQDRFAEWHVDADTQTALRKLSVLIVDKDDLVFEATSGVVIAGYGGAEHYPSMQQIELGGIYDGKLKYKSIAEQQITSQKQSFVRAFAEYDMVETFMNGVHPKFYKKVAKNLTELVLGAAEFIVNNIPEMEEEKRDAYRKKTIDSVLQSLIKPVIAELRQFRETHRGSLENAIAFMPKSEVAHVATSLVNLNAFQKRMATHEAETVGGPIDVAVISKGDGFVWIARKHYFPAELNPHFFRNQSMPRMGETGD